MKKVMTKIKLKELMPFLPERVIWLSGKLLVRIFSIIFLVVVMLLCSMAWHTWRTSRYLRREEIRHYNMGMRISTIRYLDELLSMYARMGAVTGDDKWKNHYDIFERQLNEDVEKIRGLFDFVDSLDRIEASHSRLKAVESGVFELAAEGNYQEAIALIESKLYKVEKQISREAVNRLYEVFYAKEQSRLDKERSYAFFSIVLTAGSVVLVVIGWVFALRLLKDYLYERKQTEEKLRASEEKYRVLFEANPHPMWVYGVESLKFLAVNDTAVEAYGYSREDFFSMTIKDIRPEEDVDDLLKSISKLKSGVDFGGVWRHRKKDGTVFYVETTAHGIEFEGRRAEMVLVIDVTDRKEIEEFLLEERNLLRTLIDNIPDYIFVKDIDKKFIIANKSTAKLMGAENPDQLLGKTDADFYPQEKALEYSGDEEKVLAEQKSLINKEESARGPDGNIRWYLTTKTPLYDRKDKLIGLVGIGRDVTELKKKENERLQLLKTLALKNKDLESIIYVASHDLRSSLVNIQGFSKELSDSCNVVQTELDNMGLLDKTGTAVEKSLREDIPESLGFIQLSANRLDMLLNGLLRLSRLGRAAISIEVLDMNALIKNIVDSMEYRIKEFGIEVVIEVLPICLGGYTQISQVFSNLIDNAIKYKEPSRKAVVHISGYQQEDRSIYCVEDNGIGIAKDYQDKIFEIFHQLEPGRFEGEGLGLTIVRRILERHNGDIWLESEPGQGSKFYVSLEKVK
ncbi:MAG: PAS domain S-box protein [Phycisphaerae bacterium]|nr:PAS domain S-box protein [Phycisphaerae bacterium]